MIQADQNKKIQQIIARCWVDQGFKQQLLTDPVQILNAEGVVVPEGASVHIFENTDQLLHLVIPQPPATLSDGELGRVAGGVFPTLVNAQIT